jgi:glutathione S-transferase
MPHQTIPVITAFERSPDRGRGLARDMRVRWALEEVRQPYEVHLVSFEAMKASTHRAQNPFGQIPTYEEGGLVLFESGAIVLHIATSRPGLAPDDSAACARAIMWMFAALNTIEPPIIELQNVKFAEGDKPWSKGRMPLVQDRIRERLGPLSIRLGDAEWLDGAFSAGDLMMVSVLIRLRASGLLDEYPNLSAYVARAEGRPAYQRAFAAQFAVFTDIEALKATYAAVNRNDIPVALKAFDPQMEWIERELPGVSPHRGHAEVMAALSKGRNTWAEGACEVERFIVVGNKIIVFVRARVRLNDQATWKDEPFADVYTFRNGKAIQMRCFSNRAEALEWVRARPRS